MTQLCDACGHSNSAGSRFCSSCGRSLNPENEVSTEALETFGGIDSDVTLDAPSTGAALVVASGHQAGTRYAITSTHLTVGRHPDSDIFLDDITVSRRHVELRQGSVGYLLKDVGSLNGTYLNGERLPDGETPLTNGDNTRSPLLIKICVNLR